MAVAGIAASGRIHLDEAQGFDIDKLDGLLRLPDQGRWQSQFDGKFPAWEVISVGFALCFANILGYGDLFAHGKLRQAIESIINEKALPDKPANRTEADSGT